MENQHRKIKGYRELSEAEIEMMNKVKELGKLIDETITPLRSEEALDQRWVSIGVTHLQQGLMAVTRGIAKPTFF